jgi:capsular exopolysaccharide synthesis family protein
MGEGWRVEPIEYIRAIRHRWFVVLFATLAFTAGAWATTAVVPPTARVETYQSSAILLKTGGRLNLNTIRAFVGLRPVAARAAEMIGYDGDPRDLLARVNAESNIETDLLVITATGESAEEARVLANKYAKALIGHIEESFVPGANRKVVRQIVELQQEVADIDARLALAPPAAVASSLLGERLESATLLNVLTQSYTQTFASRLGGPGLTVVQPAYRRDPIVPTGIQLSALPARLAVGGILGLVVGIALALSLTRFDTRIRSREAAEENFQLPVLAEIPLIKRADRNRVVTASDPSSPASEAFSLLGAELVREPVPYGDGDGHAGAPRGSPQTILVTSAGNAEGKSTVVANLAVALSETGKRVLVVSCDFRRPAVHRLFGVPNSEGLAQALELESANGKPVLEGHIKTTQFSDIWVVPSGPASKRPGELLSSEEMRRALSEARSAADVILLDTAPILAGSDATHLLPNVDGVLVVARAGITTSRLAERASGLLRRLRAPVLGVAFNAAESPAAPKGVRAK